jgi:hypothetical protein
MIRCFKERVMADLNWAVLGTGHIANTFAAMEEAGAAKAAVCATSLAKAETFGTQYGFARYYDHFDTMLEEAKPDVLYVAVPNLFHDKVMRALSPPVPGSGVTVQFFARDMYICTGYGDGLGIAVRPGGNRQHIPRTVAPVTGRRGIAVKFSAGIRQWRGLRLMSRR